MNNKTNESNSSALLKELVAMLRDGSFGDRDTLPKEEDLAQILKVSRTALRDVLKILEQEGYIIRVKKKGTMINRRALDAPFRIDIEYEFSQLLELAHHHPSYEILSVEKMLSNEDLASQLETETGLVVYKVAKLVLADGQPVIYCEDFLLEKNFKNPNVDPEIFKKSVYDILDETCGLRIDFNVTRLVPILADELIYNTLGYQGPMLMFRETSFTNKLQPVLYSNIYWRGDFFDLQIVRKKY